MHELDDRELRRELLDLGDEARREAPSFSALWSTARSRARREHRLVLVRRGVMAAALGLLAFVVTISLRRNPLPSNDDALLIARRVSSWSAPSDRWLNRSAAIPSGVPTLSIDSIPLPVSTNDLTNAQVEEVVR